MLRSVWDLSCLGEWVLVPFLALLLLHLKQKWVGWSDGHKGYEPARPSSSPPRTLASFAPHHLTQKTSGQAGHRRLVIPCRFYKRPSCISARMVSSLLYQFSAIPTRSGSAQIWNGLAAPRQRRWPETAIHGRVCELLTGRVGAKMPGIEANIGARPSQLTPCDTMGWTSATRRGPLDSLPAVPAAPAVPAVARRKRALHSPSSLYYITLCRSHSCPKAGGIQTASSVKADAIRRLCKLWPVRHATPTSRT